MGEPAAFVLVMSYSRASYGEYVEHQYLSMMLRCLVRGFKALGGVPQTVLCDNLKAAVQGRNSQGHVEWNPRFLNFALAVGFQPRANPRSGLSLQFMLGVPLLRAQSSRTTP